MADKEPADDLMHRIEAIGALNAEERAAVRAAIRWGRFLVQVGHVIRVTAVAIWAAVKFILSGMMLIGGAVAAWAAMKGKWPW